MALQADIDSNDVVLSIAEEVVGSIGILAGATWYAREPNTMADTGGDPSLTARSPLGTRKRLAGSIVGIDAKAGWNEDFTQNNFVRPLQGFFCADVSAEITTAPINGAAVPITSVAAADNSYNAASGLTIFLNNLLVLASGFGLAANNGLKKVTTAGTSTKVICSTGALALEASPPAAAKLEVVGIRGTAADLALTYSGGVLTLISTALDFTTLPLVVGGWFFLGGDDALNKFATAGLQGYCRIASIAAHAIVIDKSTFTPAADAGTGKKVDLYFGKYFRDPAVNKIRTYQIERKLGSDGVGTQTEYVIGAFPNELTLTIPKKEKLNVDLSFIAIDYAQQSGTTGPKAGTRVAAFGEGALNSSSDLYRMAIAPAPSAGVINPTPYFGYATDGSVKLTNNGDVNEALGSSVGFDVNVGEFDATAQFNAYFNTIALMQAVRNHVIATFDVIVARNNAGWLIDFPNAELSGGIAKPEKNKPLMVPLTANAVQNSNGYVTHMQQFVFLPAAAMPLINQSFALTVSNGL